MKDIKFIKEIGAYGITNLINAAIPFILLPFLTSYLAPEQFGIYSNYQVLLQIVTAVLGFNAISAFTRKFYEKDIDSPLYIGNVIISAWFSFGIIFLILFLFRNQLQQVTLIPDSWYIVIVCYAFFDNLFELLLTYWRVTHNPLKYGLFRILRTSAEFVCTILFVKYYSQTWEGRVDAQILSGALFGVWSVLLLAAKGQIKLKLNKSYLTHIFRFGVPLVPHTLGSIIIAYSDKIFITKFIGAADNGIYSAAFQIGLVMSLIGNSFNQAWLPWFYGKMSTSDNHDKKTVVKYTYVYYLFLVLVFCALYLLSPYIFLFIDKKYAEGCTVLIFVLLAFTFNAMYKIAVNYLFYVERTILIGVITVLTTIISLVLNYYLIPKFGINGASYALCITFFIQLIMVWATSINSVNMPWSLSK